MVITDIHTEWPIAIGTETSLLVGRWRKGVRFLAGARNSSCLEKVHTGCVAHPASYSVGPAVSFARDKWLVHPTTHCPPVLQLRMCGTVYPVARFVHALVLKQRDEIITILENVCNCSPSVTASYKRPWLFNSPSAIISNHACTVMMFPCFAWMVERVAVCGRTHRLF